MGERPENLNPAGEDPDVTLATPRFDERDAQRAHPVVPLAEAPARDASRIRRVRGSRRRWTQALLAVALLAVAAVGGAVATKYMQDSRAARAQEQTPNVQMEETQEAAPVQAAEAPEPSTPQTTEVPRAETPAASPTPRRENTRRARAVAAALAVIESEREEADDDRRESRNRRTEKRREREEEKAEKELRRASKRAKDRESRLVDVLTPSP